MSFNKNNFIIFIVILHKLIFLCLYTCYTCKIIDFYICYQILQKKNVKNQNCKIKFNYFIILSNDFLT